VSERRHIRSTHAAAAFVLAALATAVTQFVGLSVVDSPVVRAAVTGLFVGGTVFVGLRLLDRRADSEY